MTGSAKVINAAASILQMLRLLMRLEILTNKTYFRLGETLMKRTAMDNWRKANWNDYISNG